MGLFRDLIRRYVFNEDLDETEKEVLTVLAQGKGIEAESWKRVANRTGSEEAREKARKAAMEEIRLTRMVNGMTDVYSYGRAEDG
jgi:protein-disulfide isomerase-like protein with CxxC motif